MKRICCRRFSDRLIWLANDQLEGRERQQVEAHVKKCWPCLHTLNRDRAFTETLRSAARNVADGIELERVRRSIERLEARRYRIGGLSPAPPASVAFAAKASDEK